MRRVLPFQLIFLPFLKQCIDELYAELRRRNVHVSGEGAGGGLLFANMMEHFVFCAGEACFFGYHKKRCFLEGGKGFKLEAFSNDVYPLLPQLWHATLPSENRVVMAILERSVCYTLKCLNELYFEAHVLYPDMQKLRLCVSAALENPHYLEFGVPADDPGEMLPRSWRRRSRRSCR